MRVIKRDGSYENINYQKILSKCKNLCGKEKRFSKLDIDPDFISTKVISMLCDEIHTSELDTFASNICFELSIDNPDYETLAVRFKVSDIHKSTSKLTFSEMYYSLPEKIKNDRIVSILEEYSELIDSKIVSDRDYNMSYFGLTTLQRSYLIRSDCNEFVETPQHLFMRVALGISKDSIEHAIQIYNDISLGFYTHATPTLFNSGTKKEQMSSCFLLSTSDSIEGIFKTISDSAKISKWAGGLGINISNIRNKGSIIKGTNGVSSGIIPMLKMYNELSKYINQGGKRNGSISIYLEPWHPDVFDFLKIKNNTSDDEIACRNLFPALWIPDNFMAAVESDSDWYLMDPTVCVGLCDKYGEKYEKLYNKYVKQKKYFKVVKAKDLWKEIIRTQTLSGGPYIVYKDSVNKKNNQKNLGCIKGSNLCAEVVLYSSSNEYSVCNLASICLPKFVKGSEINYKMLGEYSKRITKNLNSIIDCNWYPLKETRKSNETHRPIGIGVQGFADLLYTLRIPFESEKAKEVNRKIFETIQINAIEESNNLSIEYGPYKSFENSPMSKGIFQHNMWGIKNEDCFYPERWNKLKENVMKTGLRNSVVTCLMPTVSTSQIMNNYESFEPITNNIFKRKTLAGDFTVINKFLIKDLQKLELLNTEMINKIIAKDGSIQDIDEIPLEIRNLYKTVWEISQKTLIDLSADRSPFIDMTQSLNLYIKGDINIIMSKIHSMHMYSWKSGLKTGLYYLRTKSSTEAINHEIETECNVCSS